MRGAWIVFKKEVIDNLRDRRALFTALLMPVLGPAVLGLTLIKTTGEKRAAERVPVALAVQGGEHAPALVDFLAAHRCAISATPDAKAAVESEAFKIALVIEPTFAVDLRRAEPATVRLIANESRRESDQARKRVRALLSQYSGTIGATRLLARGVDPGVIQALAIESVDLSTPESRGAVLLASLPMFIVLAVFLGGLYIAIDATAGERERESLEPLLANPISRRELVSGKLGAVAVFALAAVAMMLAGYGIMPLLIPPDALSFPLRLEPSVLAKALALVAPLVLLASALQTWAAARAKGFKEAQALLSYISLVPMIPSMMVALSDTRATRALSWIPILGEQLFIGQLLRGEPLDPLMVAACLAATTLVAAGFVGLAVRRYSDERIIL